MKAKDVAKQLFPESTDWVDDWAKRHADNMKSCACWMCKNPRKSFKEETLQEKKFKENIWYD